MFLQSTEFAVKNVQVRGGYVLHVGSIEGRLKIGDGVTCTIDAVRNPPHCGRYHFTYYKNDGMRANSHCMVAHSYAERAGGSVFTT